ncbi:carboxymuconolactone decarboxylase family protein, partial [bacterium I07]
MAKSLEEFQQYRERMNEKILGTDNLQLKRFFALDGSVYRDGALDRKTKELMGLVSSTVLRCNDCILYHLTQCIENGVTDEEFHETLSIALIVGGSITIPH